MSAANRVPFLRRLRTDWELCCLCQEESRRDLRCPYNKECHHKAYGTLENDLKNFVANDVPLPLGVNLECLDDGSGIAQTLLKNKAKYHNGCRSLFRCNMMERELNKRKQEDNKETIVSPKKTRSSFNATLDRLCPQCVCCEKFEVDGDEPIYRARSANCGKNLLKWATESENWVVHARLNTAINAEDAEAADIHYHHTCYTHLKNAARAASATPRNTTKSSSCQQPYDPLVIAELLAFVKFNHFPYPHKLSALRKLYDDRIQTLGSEWTGLNVHPSRFKDHLLKKLGSDWSAYNEGKEVYISHKKTVGVALAEIARPQVTEEEAEKIVDVAVMLRKYILQKQMPFGGSFNSQSQSGPVPQPLLTLIGVLLEGSSSITQRLQDDEVSHTSRMRVACTISQIICSNAIKQTSQTETLYQRRERETPLPLYVGLKLHVNDRQKGNISIFHGLGMSVSYDRVMEVRKNFAKAVSKRWAEDGVVVPTNIKRGVFVTSAVDNLDESGRCEFHGTAMTLTSHPTTDNMGEDPPPLRLDLLDKSPVQLPYDYANVPYVDEYAGDIHLSPSEKELPRPTFDENLQRGAPDEAWLKHVYDVSVDRDGELQEKPVTYSGFFSHLQSAANVRPRATVGMFPIFYEKASSMAMQKHSMLVTMKATEFVNPGQVPVIVGDLPIYIQQKKCQWKYPDEVGETKMVCLMGFLHIEMASQECGGKLLAGSGWERMFSLAKVFTPGVAASLLGGKHVKRTRYSYHLTLAWLHILKVQTYNEYCQESYGPHESMEMWERRLAEEAPTICYWRTVNNYLLIICRLVRGQRLGDWQLTLNACTDLCPWFFAFGHTNYARWMPVFLRDMTGLPEIHPSIHEEFVEGKFVVQRSRKKFSLMALDQSQEHSIKFLKEDSGTKGLYGQQEEKEVIELSKPEVLRVMEEFENVSISASNKDVSLEHPESSVAEQKKFLQDLKTLLNLVKEGTVVNPFKETGPELVTLDTGEIMDPEIAKSLKDAPEIGKNKFSEFVHDRIERASKPLSDVIPRIKLYTFSNRPPPDLKRGPNKLETAKTNTALITKLFLSLQARPEADINDFFKHENHREPPALSSHGKLMAGTKSSLLSCIPGMPDPGLSPTAKEASVLVCDMSAIIHMVKPHRANVFGEYTQKHLLPFLESQMTNRTTRIDAVWDTYQDASLKSQTRARRGETLCQRSRVSANIIIPKEADWQKFLKESHNKDHLFHAAYEFPEGAGTSTNRKKMK